MTVRVAPLWRRALAALIDLVAVLALFAAATWAIVASDPSPPEIPPWNTFDRVVDYIQLRPGRTAFVLLTLCVIHVAWTWLWSAASTSRDRIAGGLGHRVLGLGLVDAHGERPTHGRLAGWLLARLPSTLIAGIGVWWAIVDVERRTLHDRLAGVWVIDVRAPRAPSR